jgi:NADH dehydrogenase FAD-containing subunit
MTGSRIAVIGGGYAGYALAMKLDRSLDVTLIDARGGFVHNVAAIRAAVAPELVAKIVFPYTRLLKHGRVVRGRAKAILRDEVELEDGRRIKADYIVAATGSGYAAPFKPSGDDTRAFQLQLASVGQQIQASDHIVIVGAGAVGVELAGEIKAAMPSKEVSLVSDFDRLFPRYPSKLHDSLVNKLKQLNVHLYLGHKAAGLQSVDAPYEGEIALQDGKKLAGLVIPAIGSKVWDSPAHHLEGVTRRPNGQLAVDQWLRPSALPNLFAIGDLADTGDGMTVVATMRQVPWLAKAIGALARGKSIEKVPAYKPWPMPPILLPLGASKGASVLPFSRNGTVVGDWMTATMKGKSLFIPRYEKEFGVKSSQPGAAEKDRT